MPREAGHPGRAARLAAFYDGAIPPWQAVLGEELHYHHGLFDAAACADDDGALDRALRRAVTDLYPFIPAGSRVLDVGCGWGGPLAMLVGEHGCEGMGITISRVQACHARGRGLHVRQADAERMHFGRGHDVAMLLESLEHVHDKSRLLRCLRASCRLLVARVNCQDHAPASVQFGGTMPMVDSTTLRRLLEAAGWRVRHWRDRREESLPSHAAWRTRLERLPAAVVAADPHLAIFLDWCRAVLAHPQAWGEANPLVEVVAE